MILGVRESISVSGSLSFKKEARRGKCRYGEQGGGNCLHVLYITSKNLQKNYVDNYRNYKDFERSHIQKLLKILSFFKEEVNHGTGFGG